MHYVRTGRAIRLRRGAYRLVHFPAGEHEELVAAWLWSEREGVVSHQTALGLHGLSDALPAHVHLTLPSAWRRRRLRLPADVVLHHADVPPEERAWFGAVPTTNPRRSLNDCAREGLSPPKLRLYPIETHIAEKLHAYTMPRPRPNSRVKDLPDIALLATARPLPGVPGQDGARLATC